MLKCDPWTDQSVCFSVCEDKSRTSNSQGQKLEAESWWAAPLHLVREFPRIDNSNCDQINNSFHEFNRKCELKLFLLQTAGLASVVADLSVLTLRVLSLSLTLILCWCSTAVQFHLLIEITFRCLCYVAINYRSKSSDIFCQLYNLCNTQLKVLFLKHSSTVFNIQLNTHNFTTPFEIGHWFKSALCCYF